MCQDENFDKLMSKFELFERVTALHAEAFLVNSFTVNGTGGNPAGVVLNAENLSDDQKLKIAS